MTLPAAVGVRPVVVRVRCRRWHRYVVLWPDGRTVRCWTRRGVLRRIRAVDAVRAARDPRAAGVVSLVNWYAMP